MEFLISTTIMVAGTLWVAMLVAVLLGKMISSVWPRPSITTQKWIGQAVEAEALVLRTEQTSYFVNKLPLTRIQLQVRPLKGRNFVAEIKQTLSETEAAAFKTGSLIRVKYDPHNYKALILIITV